MRSLVVAAVVAAGLGCGHVESGMPDAAADEGVDAGGSAADATESGGFSNLPGGLGSASIGALAIRGDSWLLDTDAQTLTAAVAGVIGTVVPQANGPELLVVTIDSLEIEADSSLSIVGGRPLILVVDGAVAIDGAIDIAARGALAGAGSAAASCAIGRGNDGPVAGTNGAGGGGGGFGSAGGSGRREGGFESPGGGENGEVALVPLRGGCAGGSGGFVSGAPSSGGGGGGALQISSYGTIIIGAEGSINAAGGGGAGGFADSGGGAGGGAGGAILLESATALRVDGFLSATGGGGGGGSRITAGGDGQDGALGAGGAGGLDSSLGSGNGGSGAAGIAGGEIGGPSNRGGGGGGGGGGRIRLRAPIRDIAIATIAPPPTQAD